MKTILALGFLLLASQQVSAQTLPNYDLSYYDSPECAKEQADKYAKSRHSKPDEALGKTMCKITKTSGNYRRDLEKRWNAIPSEIRLRCIANLEHARKMGQVSVVDYSMLQDCIAREMKQ